MDSKVLKAPKSQTLKAKPEEKYNLFGQRLGRKGQETRERILVAALHLIETSQDLTITLSAIAREVSVRMTNLYLYFPDLGDLVLACLSRVMDTADEAYMVRLRERWPDDALFPAVLDFLRAHYQFCHNHMNLLHMRNSLADAGDSRFVEYRREISRPIMDALILQMDGRLEETDSHCADLATVIMAGFERLATVMTKSIFHSSVRVAGIIDEPAYIERLMVAEAKMITMVIRHQRDAVAPLVKSQRRRGA